MKQPGQSFASRARRSAGMRAFTAPATVALPGPNVFAPFVAKKPCCCKGMGAFMAPAARTVFPGKNVFRGLGRLRRLRRGMGDDSISSSDYSSALDNLYSSGLAPVITNDPNASDLWNGVLSPDASSTYSVPTFGGSGVVTLPASSSNPSLDAFNQALTNAQAGNASLTNPNTLANLSNAVASATPTQLAGATTALSTSGASSFLTSLGTWASQNMGLLLLGGGIFALALVAGGKKRR